MESDRVEVVRRDWAHVAGRVAPSMVVVGSVGIDSQAIDKRMLNTARSRLSMMEDDIGIESTLRVLSGVEDEDDEVERWKTLDDGRRKMLQRDRGAIRKVFRRTMDDESFDIIWNGDEMSRGGWTKDDVVRVPKLILRVDLRTWLRGEEEIDGGKREGVERWEYGDSAGVCALPLRCGWSCRLERELGWARCAVVVFSGLAGVGLRRSLRAIAQRGFYWGGWHWEYVHARAGEQRAIFVATNGPSLLPLTPSAILAWHAPPSRALAQQSPLKRAGRADLMLSKARPTLRCTPHPSPTASTPSHGFVCQLVSVPDVLVGGEVRTDGSGFISPEAMRAVVTKAMGRAPQGTAWPWVAEEEQNVPIKERTLPTALQGRLGGHKGVWVVNPTWKGLKVGVRPSQRKVDLFIHPVTIKSEEKESVSTRKKRGDEEDMEHIAKLWASGGHDEGDGDGSGRVSGGVGGGEEEQLTGVEDSSNLHPPPSSPMSPSTSHLTPTQETLEVMRFSSPPAPASTHFALLVLLLSWGCPCGVLRARLSERAAELRRALRYLETCKRVLLEAGHGATIDQVAATSTRSQVGRAAALIAYGMDAEPAVASATYNVGRAELDAVVDRGALRIEQSRSLLLVPDPTGLLQPGQVFVHFSCPPTGVSHDGILRGPVLVARAPCHAASDLQAWTAVNLKPRSSEDEEEVKVVEQWKQSLVDVLVLPTSSRAAMDLANGDFDGDVAWVCFDHDIADPVFLEMQRYRRKLRRERRERGEVDGDHSGESIPDTPDRHAWLTPEHDRRSPTSSTSKHPNARHPLQPYTIPSSPRRDLLPSFAPMDLPRQETPLSTKAKKSTSARDRGGGGGEVGPRGGEEREEEMSLRDGEIASLTPELSLAAWLRSMNPPPERSDGSVSISLGQASNLHLAWSDLLLERREQRRSEESLGGKELTSLSASPLEHPACVALAEACKVLVDANKTGATVAIDAEWLRVQRPDFLPSSSTTKRVRESRSPLALLLSSARVARTDLDRAVASLEAPSVPREIAERVDLYCTSVQAALDASASSFSIQAMAQAVFRAAQPPPGSLGVRELLPIGDGPSSERAAAFEDEAADEAVAAVAQVRRAASCSAARHAFELQRDLLAEAIATTFPTWTRALHQRTGAARHALQHAALTIASNALAAACYHEAWTAAKDGRGPAVPTRHWDICLHELLEALGEGGKE